jgi:hypothetical protein
MRARAWRPCGFGLTDVTNFVHCTEGDTNTLSCAHALGWPRTWSEVCNLVEDVLTDVSDAWQLLDHLVVAQIQLVQLLHLGGRYVGPAHYTHPPTQHQYIITTVRSTQP